MEQLFTLALKSKCNSSSTLMALNREEANAAVCSSVASEVLKLLDKTDHQVL